MWRLIERITQGLDNLRPFEQNIVDHLKISDVFRPYHEVIPGASPEPPVRLMVRGEDEEDGSMDIYNSSPREGLANNRMVIPKFQPLMKRSRKIFGKGDIKDSPPPAHISHGLWLGLRALLEYYAVPLLEQHPDIMDREIDDECIDLILDEFRKECDERGIWWMGQRSYRALSGIDHRTKYIPLVFPAYHIEDERTGIYEAFLEGPEGVAQFIAYQFEGLEPESLPKGIRDCLQENVLEQLLETYAQSNAEKSVDLEGICNHESTYGQIYGKHQLLNDLKPPLVTDSYEGVQCSLLEKADVNAFFDYSEAFFKQEEKVPEWAWEQNTHEIIKWLGEVLRVCKEAKGEGEVETENLAA